MNGEVFVFASPDSSGDLANAGKATLIRPQKAWVLKKKYRAVKVLGWFIIRAQVMTKQYV